MVGAGADALWGECPPAPACGRRLPLYFAPKGIRTHVPACAATRGNRGLYCKPAIHGPARPAGLRGKIKEEAFAAGGGRRTFAPKACRSRRARQIATRPVIDQEGPSPDLGEEPKKSHPYRAVRARPGWQTSL